ncbi:abortive infection family protein [Lentimicrobium sp. L6]|uniref:abortive infection family protein n=1 Tax=Lentimicrobium sp. L6 TaxID=2735916 RepID=UPI00155297BF|nr:abortive infection family protein [Lentimicrobium sp. L6]NPD86403.1 abortive infection family protein [Lentimicrobium sp. L6]
MADITRREKLKLEKLFDMGGGYVLDFSNRTLSDFVFETLDIDLYSDKYSDNGDSKANRLRTIWQKENNYSVGKLMSEMLDYWKDQKAMSYSEISQPEQNLYEECGKIAKRLLEGKIIEEIEVIQGKEDDKDFSLLAKSIRESIEKNEPEAALDRLHTYAMKFTRRLCENHGIEIKKDESLNALFGKYVKFIVASEKIESKMTERILKYSIHVIEAFNDIRNNRSFAHDNVILNYSESVLIFNNVTNSIKFIESIEKTIEQENKEEEKESIDWEDLPF